MLLPLLAPELGMSTPGRRSALHSLSRQSTAPCLQLFCPGMPSNYCFCLSKPGLALTPMLCLPLLGHAMLGKTAFCLRLQCTAGP